MAKIKTVGKKSNVYEMSVKELHELIQKEMSLHINETVYQGITWDESWNNKIQVLTDTGMDEKTKEKIMNRYGNDFFTNPSSATPVIAYIFNAPKEAISFQVWTKQTEKVVVICIKK